MEKKMIKKMILISLIFTLLIACLQIISFANTTGQMYFKAVNNSDNTVISNFAVAVYQVSQTIESGSTLSKGFENCTIDLDNSTKNSLEELKQYAETNAKPLYTKTTDENGNFVLTDLDLGEYLIIQKNHFEDYTMQTMLITIPELTSENGLNYDVNIKPKIVTKTIEEDVPMVEDETLPDTGVLSWPVPVLVVLGIAVFCIGWLKFYTNSKKKVN